MLAGAKVKPERLPPHPGAPLEDTAQDSFLSIQSIEQATTVSARADDGDDEDDEDMHALGDTIELRRAPVPANPALPARHRMPPTT